MSKARDIVELVRPHQWAKNVLVVAPLFFSGQLTSGGPGAAQARMATVIALLVFSLAASSCYAANDAFDAELDRAHPNKSQRPVASGRISPQSALGVAALCALGAISVSALCSFELVKIIILYQVLQILYSIRIKHVAIVDLLVLSSSYVLRVLAGAAATGITPSNWIVIVTGLSALMLATGKRYLELVRYRPLRNRAVTRPVLSQYPAPFLRQVMSSMGAALLVTYLLWCNENVVLGRFRAIEIFPTAIFVTYGILRYLLLVYRRSFNDDPTLGLIRDAPIVISVFVFLFWIGMIIR